MKAANFFALKILFFFIYAHGTSGRSVTVPGLGTYTLHEEKKSYSDAARQCQKERGYLVVINSKEEEDVLVDLMEAASTVSAYVGVNDIAIEGFMVTALGDMWASVGYSKWREGEPNNVRKAEHCVNFNKNDRALNDEKCERVDSFLCERIDATVSSKQGNAFGTTAHGRYVAVPRVGSYRLFLLQVPYSEAAQICESDDAHLVVINSNEEEDVVINIMQGARVPYIFVGINDIASEGHMVTILGAPATSAVLKWRQSSNEPNNRYGEEHCGVLMQDRIMNDVMCGTIHNFVCEKHATTSKKTARSGGYVTVPGVGSYILHEYSLKYNEAAQVCENEGAHLAVINSKQEEDFLMRLLQSSYWSMAYIGVNDLAAEGNMTTVLGESWPTVGYSKWARGEPNNADNKEDCVVIESNRLLKDVECSLKIAYYCEKRIPANNGGGEQSSVSPYINVTTVGSYKLHSEMKTYKEATSICVSEGAHLAIINSKEVEDALVKLFEGTQRSEAFVGINDIAVEGRFVTVLNEPYLRGGYYNWAAGEPRDTNGLEDCVVFGKDRTVRVLECGDRAGFFCEKTNGCPGLPADPHTRTQCVFDKVGVDCSETGKPGTAVTMGCAQGFTLTSRGTFFSAICQANNTWSDRIPKCERDCGKMSTPNAQEYVSRGHSVRAGALPWHVGVFKLINGKYDHQCGGTLISPHLVVTAAHCLWDAGSESASDKALFYVAAGQISIDFEKPEMGTQTRGVAELIIPDQFTGSVNFYQSDIALVRLTHRLEMSRTVDIVCVDWHNELPAIEEGENGTVAGWGLNENMIRSQNLMAVQLAYVPYKRCWNMFKKNYRFRPYITSDKLCAGWTERGTSVCPGDSGGGLVFPVDQALGTRYYLRGLVSVGPTTPARKCNVDNVTAFTDIATHLPFLRRHIKP